MPGAVHVEKRERGIALVTVDHQERLNAMSNAMWERMGEIFHELHEDEALRCVVLTGAGERAFGAGADISEFEENRSSVEKARAYARRVHGALGRLAGCRHPVLAAIRGLCVGGGLETALGADLRICGEGSRFGIPIKRLGLTVAYSEMAGLIQAVGKSNALRILLEGELYGAEEAYDMGLVNKVVADGAVMDEALAMALRIAEGAPLVARWHKRFAGRLMDPRPLDPEEEDEQFHCFGTEDYRIGYRAFLAKHKPEFTGR